MFDDGDSSGTCSSSDSEPESALDPYRRPAYERTVLQVRRVVVYQCEVLGYSSAQIAVSLDMSLRTVQRILARWKNLGTILDNPARDGPPRVMTELHLQFMVGLLQSQPSLYLDELADELYYIHNVDVSLSTVYRAIKQLGLTNKQLSKRAAERSEMKRGAYMLEIGKVPVKCLTFCDEAAFNELNIQRKFGYAPKGERAISIDAFVRGQRYSVLPALSLSGVLYTAIRPGSFDGESFLEFIDRLVEVMNPYPLPNSCLVLDNCAIHHVDGVRERCEAKGIKIIYLPPYSPDYNPVEELFSAIKAYARRHSSRFRAIMKAKDYNGIVAFIREALQDVMTEGNLEGWFRRYL